MQMKTAIKQYYADKNGTVVKKTVSKVDEEYDDEVDSEDEDAIAQIKRKYRAP